ncbi:hypothetical protein [Fictibacillus barbaricus]|uniref:Uncharacterized protein n=1 Tax=Fictibacillus barbaricus TaxID=182136 RepID=A0ABU1U1K1_9BACL|nr:hypothetical protein [Fictibacillus barbaricus]MDR7073323.1 hypothetical protein [Fictibacillus barbaricus]
MFSDLKNTQISYILISIIACLIGFYPIEAFQASIFIICLILYINFFKINVIFIHSLIIFILLNNFLQMLAMNFNIISPGSLIGISLYYLPILVTWLLIIYPEKLQLSNIYYIDLMMFFILIYLLLKTFTTQNPYGYQVLIISFLRIGLFIPAYFLGRKLIIINKIEIDKVIIFFTWILFVVGLLDILTKHKVLGYFGLDIFIGSNLYENESMTIFFKAGFPRMMSVFLSPLALGSWCSSIALYWYYKLITGQTTKIMPLILNVIMLILTITRASWLSFLGGLILLTMLTIFFNPKIRKEKYFAKNIKKLLTIIFLLLLGVSLFVLNNSAFNRNIFTISDSSSIGHSIGLSKGIESIGSNLIFGNGVGISPFFLSVTGNGYGNFESWYLDSIYSVGLFFTIFFNIVAFLALIKIKHQIKSLLLTWFLLFSFESLFINHTWYQNVPVLLFWGCLGYFISFEIFNKENRRGKNHENNITNF